MQGAIINYTVLPRLVRSTSAEEMTGKHVYGEICEGARPNRLQMPELVHTRIQPGKHVAYGLYLMPGTYFSHCCRPIRLLDHSKTMFHDLFLFFRTEIWQKKSGRFGRPIVKYTPKVAREC